MREAVLARFGRLDVWIGNAGVIEPIARLSDADPADWARAVQINLTGVFHGMRAVLPVMKSQGGGTVITISSGAAHNPLEGWSGYCASKAGALMLTRAAQDLTPHDVAFYLRELAAAFHAYYAAERFLVDDAALAAARMALLSATRQVLRNGLAVLGVGVLCSGVAYLLYFRLVMDIGPTSALTVTFLTPVFGVLWGHLFLDETLGWHTLVGGLVVLAGTGLAAVYGLSEKAA